MSTQITHDERANGVATGPARRIIASCQTYRDAEQDVERLSDAGFAVERAQILGSGLRFVEQDTGRRGYGQAALEGALAGAMVGLLVRTRSRGSRSSSSSTTAASWTGSSAPLHRGQWPEPHLSGAPTT